MPLGPGAPASVVLAEVIAPRKTPRGQLWPLCAGSGRTLQQARVSGRAEAIERMAGFLHGDEPRIRASQIELGAAAIDPHHHLMYSERQYRNRGRSEPPVPRPFNPRATIEWSPLTSALTGETRYLPTQLLYHGYRASPMQSFGRADSNGRAAGRLLGQAKLRGLLELIERDSVAQWWYNRIRRPALPLDERADPYVRRVAHWHGMVGRECWALDLTGDLGIPVVAAVSRDPRGQQDILLGFGAHLVRRRAVVRAFLELAQMHAVLLAMREGLFTLHANARRWFRDATLANQPHLRPRGTRAGPARSRAVGTRQRRALVTFARCARMLAEHGLDVFVSDQTRGEYGLHVAKVVVPGLRSWWPRFAPGRLYEAPVRAGWIERPRHESALNPIPIWF